MEKVVCYCQNCRAANQLGETQCRNCGTRLLLVIFPQSLKFDTNHVPSYYEDHLLERVTLLELRLAQVTEQLAMAYEFIKRESTASKKNRLQINSVIENLEQSNPEFSKKIKAQKRDSGDESKTEIVNVRRQDRILHEILAFQGEKSKELLAHLINESFNLFEKNEEKQAFQMLKRAELISPDNFALLLFIAENLIRADNFAEAKKYLENLFEKEAQNEKVLLLLGAVYADHAELEKARKLISLLAEKPLVGDLVNYIWGMLAAFEENWVESAAAFKLCLQNNDSPEINYLLGCAYFQSGNYKNALIYLKKANLLDAKFADSWFMQSVIYQLLNKPESANEFVKSALISKEPAAQSVNFLKKKMIPKLETALPFQHFVHGKNILTKGSHRLGKFFRRQILESLD